MRKVCAYIEERQNHELLEMGFLRRNITAKNGHHYTLYCEDHVEFLKERLNSSLADEIISPWTSGSGMCHPMNAHVGESMYKGEDVTERSPDASVSWRDLRIDGEQSMVEALQRYKDKLQISITADALEFCSFHITILNIPNIKGGSLSL